LSHYHFAKTKHLVLKAGNVFFKWDCPAKKSAYWQLSCGSQFKKPWSGCLAIPLPLSNNNLRVYRHSPTISVYLRIGVEVGLYQETHPCFKNLIIFTKKIHFLPYTPYNLSTQTINTMFANNNEEVQHYNIKYSLFLHNIINEALFID